jgi:SAM-dependent methyltransferase
VRHDPVADVKNAFWESAENVERFAAREPDVRLAALIPGYADPRAASVLDLGCAGGRNTVFLARLGFDVLALDASEAMVAETRRRMTPIVGEAEAERRVRVGRMDDLGWAPAASFDLVVALGLYHCAQSRAEWDRSLSETARVLAPGGQLLVSVFTPETDLTGRGISPVPGEPHVYEGFESGRSVLVDAPTLDAELARHGLSCVVPTVLARRQVEVGRRVSANGLYLKS